MKNDSSFDTLAVHAGEERSENFGAVSVPIYTSSLFAFSDADEGAAIHNYKKDGYFYSRLGNPTQAALERTVAELENTESCLAFASGMAAVSAAVLTLVKTGDHIVAPASMYSTSSNLFRHLEANFGIAVTFVDAANAENYRSAIRPETRLFWIETPSNPLVKITDLAAVAVIAKEHAITTVADNTFATPYNQRPAEHGIDIVMHSATKYFGGHSDLTAGLLAGRSEIIETIRHGASVLYGGNIAPQVAWLVLRGIKTLALRMERHNSNAAELARRLSEHPKVTAVYYPGLPSHENHEIAARQMRGFGGMIGFDLGNIADGKSFVNRVRLCTLATSLGGVESIVQHSASMTHATLSPEERAKAGVTEGLIRFSVGIENVDDIWQDVYDALL